MMGEFCTSYSEKLCCC